MQNSYETRFDFEHQRQRMIEQDLAGRDIVDESVLNAISSIPRHRFVDPSLYPQAYADIPLSIGCSQTISQPYIVACMTQLLQVAPGTRVLEIGTGSGYQTAILAAMGATVYTVERHEPLTERASLLLSELGLDSTVEFLVGDGSLGDVKDAPFERILVTAAAPTPPPALIAQLADGGRLVIPVGTREQHLLLITRMLEKVRTETHIPVIFVPLVGEQGVRE